MKLEKVLQYSAHFLKVGVFLEMFSDFLSFVDQVKIRSVYSIVHHLKLVEHQIVNMLEGER